LYPARLIRQKEKTTRICWLKGSSEARKEEFCRKAYYKWILTFNVLVKF
jgi:hypothetical protein